MLKRLENWVFYIFIFAIPISVRHIFGYEEFGFIEWTAVYLYLTDILLLILLGLWAFERSRNHKTNVRSRAGEIEQKIQQNFYAVSRWLRPSGYFLLSFVVVAGISISNALDIKAAVFGWLKLIEGVALYFYIKDYAVKRFSLDKALIAVVAGGVFQSVIAITQFVTQGSLGLKYLGESPLIPAMSGIAAFFSGGIKIIRAYGTTPHSNVLALYLFVALGASILLSLRKNKMWWLNIFYIVILWGFLLTFSRVVIGLWGIGFIAAAAYVFYPRPRKPVPSVSPQAGPLPLLGPKTQAAAFKNIILVTIGVLVVFLACYWPYVVNRSAISANDEAVQLRVLYNNESLSSGHNLLGVGVGNFVPWLMTQDLHLDRHLYQPVHNIYLLIYSEVGIVGIALFLLFLAFLVYDFLKAKELKNLHNLSLALILASILLFGLFDHYLWTIQTGRLIFWGLLGLMASNYGQSRETTPKD